MLVNILQISICVLALTLQAVATMLATPLRPLVSPGTWRLIMLLTLAVFGRRLVSLIQLVWGWSGGSYHWVTVSVGMCVSLAMMGAVVHLRRYIRAERRKAVELAVATIDLARHANAENSVAYQLALHFVRLREERERLAADTAVVLDAAVKEAAVKALADAHINPDAAAQASAAVARATLSVATGMLGKLAVVEPEKMLSTAHASPA